jgi:hypothetical protein
MPTMFPGHGSCDFSLFPKMKEPHQKQWKHPASHMVGLQITSIAYHGCGNTYSKDSLFMMQKISLHHLQCHYFLSNSCMISEWNSEGVNFWYYVTSAVEKILNTLRNNSNVQESYVTFWATKVHLLHSFHLVPSQLRSCCQGIHVSLCWCYNAE